MQAKSDAKRESEEPSPLHRRYYVTSAIRTVLFYGSVLVICFLGHALVALFIAVFFLRFYRKGILEALRHPAETLRLTARAPSPYRLEVLRPGSLARRE